MSWTKISSDHYWRDNQSGTSSVSSCSSSDESESVISVTSGNDGDVSGREQEEDMDENGPSNNDGSGDDVEDELDEEELKFGCSHGYRAPCFSDANCYIIIFVSIAPKDMSKVSLYWMSRNTKYSSILCSKLQKKASAPIERTDLVVLIIHLLVKSS